MSVPWKKIFRHPGMYAIIIAHIGQTWGQVTLYSEVPAFMDKIMGVNIKAVNMVLMMTPFSICSYLLHQSMNHVFVKTNTILLLEWLADCSPVPGDVVHKLLLQLDDGYADCEEYSQRYTHKEISQLTR